MKIRIHLLLLVLLLAACNPSSETRVDTTPAEELAAAPSATPTKEPTETPTETPTSTHTPTDTPEPTNTSTPTETPTETPSPTHTPSPTLTPSPTYTPSPTPSNTPIPPTPVPPRPEAHLFATTIIEPFSRDSFIHELQELKTNFVDLNEKCDLISFGRIALCHPFQGFHSIMTSNRLGFTDVPDSYYALYHEYRSIIQQAVAVSQEIEDVCAAGGGEVSVESFENTREHLKLGISRIEQMIGEAQQISG
ncbi:MAG: hypothetical protein JXA42_02890 [Anaerolineales bacterium]|nr:hypothetical protein [Anaerolineales bacterium]